MSSLWVVMPVYNEAHTVCHVIEQWLPVFRSTGVDFTFCVLNDGSTDTTYQALLTLKQQVPELFLVDKPNSGHGQTCIEGYRLALSEGAEWVFQLDSDGQCDPLYFPALWDKRLEHPVLYGYRKKRHDGRIRFFISRIVTLVSFLPTGVWVHDANVPYRLMHASSIQAILPVIPADFYLANILVALLQHKYYRISWIPISFLQRPGGEGSVNGLGFLRQGLRLFQQLFCFWWFSGFRRV